MNNKGKFGIGIVVFIIGLIMIFAPILNCLSSSSSDYEVDYTFSCMSSFGNLTIIIIGFVLVIISLIIASFSSKKSY
jgi:uncharacterized membrane protein